MNNNKKGFGLVEVIVAGGLFVVTAVMGLTTILHSYTVNRLASDESEAKAYAQSGIEAVRQIRASGWNKLTLGDHGLSEVGGVWSFNGISDTQGKYRRVISLTEVQRDANGQIVVNGGSVDTDVIKVSSLVEWDFTSSRKNKVELISYLSNFQKPIPTIRAQEYYVDSGFTTLDYNLKLRNKLMQNYFVIVAGSDGSTTGNSSFGPDDNYIRLVADPFGTGDLGVSGGSKLLSFHREGSGGVGWKGVITVVECLINCDTAGFNLLDVKQVEHLNGNLSGSVNTGVVWTNINQVMLMGGYTGAGCSTIETQTKGHKSCHVRIYPSGNQTINWRRNGGGVSLKTAVSTVMAIEWGSEWGVQRKRVTGTEGGNGANSTNEYSQATINSVLRDNTWVWGVGFTADNGIGDGGEGSLITLGDGVNQNLQENKLAVGQEYKDNKDFEVYALTHPKLKVDYRFKPDGNKNDLLLDVSVDANSGSDTRMSLITNGSNGTGTAYPRPIWSARYLDANTVRLERRYYGQKWPAWIEGIDFSQMITTLPTCGTVVSSDVPKAISSSGTPTITSSLNLAGLTGVITDVNLVSLRGSHTYIGDLNFNLTSPMGTTVRVMDNSCGSANDFDLNLDDQAPAGAWPCPPIGGGTYQPSNPLSNFNNQDPNGTWILTVNDTANLDGGSLDSWGLEVCSE